MDNQKLKNLPLIICWGIWIIRNHRIFQDKDILGAVVCNHMLATYNSIPKDLI